MINLKSIGKGAEQYEIMIIISWNLSLTWKIEPEKYKFGMQSLFKTLQYT